MQGLIVGQLNKLLLEHVEERKHKFEELTPTPNDKSLPQNIDQVAVLGVLVAGREQSNDPRYNVALGGDRLFFEVVTDFRMEYSQKTLKLIHLYFQYLELVGK